MMELRQEVDKRMGETDLDLVARQHGYVKPGDGLTNEQIDETAKRLGYVKYMPKAQPETVKFDLLPGPNSCLVIRNCGEGGDIKLGNYIIRFAVGDSVVELCASADTLVFTSETLQKYVDHEIREAERSERQELTQTREQLVKALQERDELRLKLDSHVERCHLNERHQEKLETAQKRLAAIDAGPHVYLQSPGTFPLRYSRNPVE